MEKIRFKATRLQGYDIFRFYANDVHVGVIGCMKSIGKNHKFIKTWDYEFKAPFYGRHIGLKSKTMAIEFMKKQFNKQFKLYSQTINKINNPKNEKPLQKIRKSVRQRH